MSNSENGNGRSMVMRVPSLPVVVSIVAVVVAALSMLGGWAGGYLTLDRTATATIEQLKAKNDLQDSAFQATAKHLESRVDNLKAIYDQRYENILHQMQETQRATQQERSEVRQILTTIQSDMAKATIDIARMAERQSTQPPNQRGR